MSHERGNVTSTKAYMTCELKSYLAVEAEAHARTLERCFKSGSGKAFAKKRLLSDSDPADGRSV